MLSSLGFLKIGEAFRIEQESYVPSLDALYINVGPGITRKSLVNFLMRYFWQFLEVSIFEVM